MLERLRVGVGYDGESNVEWSQYGAMESHVGKATYLEGAGYLVGGGVYVQCSCFANAAGFVYRPNSAGMYV